MAKQPRVYVNCVFYAKDLPDGYRGLTRENWSFGKERPVTLSRLLKSITSELIQFYAATMPDSTEAVNEQIAIAAEYIGGLSLKEEAPDDTP